ncbi:hypothetical protein COOONC_27151 [Cooperia oncophora]
MGMVLFEPCAFLEPMFSLICHFASAVVGALIPVFYSYKVLKRPTQKSLVGLVRFLATTSHTGPNTGLYLGHFLLLTLYSHRVLFTTSYLSTNYSSSSSYYGPCVHKQPERSSSFDKVLSPFIRRHEKNMDVYIERFVSAIINHGPDMAMTVTV